MRTWPIPCRVAGKSCHFCGSLGSWTGPRANSATRRGRSTLRWPDRSPSASSCQRCMASGSPNGGDRGPGGSIPRAPAGAPPPGLPRKAYRPESRAPSGGSVDAGKCSERPGRHDRLHIPGGQGPASNATPGQRQATAHSPQAGMPVPRGRPWACPSNYATLPDCVRSRSTNSAKSDRHWLRSVGHHAMNFIVLVRPSSWCW